MEKKINIYLKKTKFFKKRKHVCFLLFVLGIFMLPLLLMCQCCGRDLHLATHATILWCCPRMYQHEIKKNIWLFLLFLYLCSLRKKEFGTGVLLIESFFSHEWPWWIFNLFHNDVHQNNDQCALLVCRISKFAWKNKSCLHFLSTIPLFWLGMVPFVEEMGSEEAVRN